MTGTYAIKLHKNEFETENDTLVLKQEGESLRGCLAEFLFTVVFMNNGKTDGENFSFSVTPFQTIYGDMFIGVEGKVSEEGISGVFSTGLGNIRFTGVKTSEYTPYL